MKDIFSLTGKRIIVTGAASGIGCATANLLQDLGADSLLLDINQREDINITPCDLTDFENVKRVILDTGQKFDGLVHCAGVPSIVPLRALSMSEFERVNRINVEAGLNLAKIFASRKVHNPETRCSIVFISSVYGITGSSSNVAYSAGKAAVIGITRSLAVELAPKIRVNCVAPGFVKTEMGGKINYLFDESHDKLVESMHPLGYGEPLDIAGGIAFLLSDASKWMTGSVLNIDGGFTAC